MATLLLEKQELVEGYLTLHPHRITIEFHPVGNTVWMSEFRDYLATIEYEDLGEALDLFGADSIEELMWSSTKGWRIPAWLPVECLGPQCVFNPDSVYHRD